MVLFSYIIQTYPITANNYEDTGLDVLYLSYGCPGRNAGSLDRVNYYYYFFFKGSFFLKPGFCFRVSPARRVRTHHMKYVI